MLPKIKQQETNMNEVLKDGFHWVLMKGESEPFLHVGTVRDGEVVAVAAGGPLTGVLFVSPYLIGDSGLGGDEEVKDVLKAFEDFGQKVN
jgi:hypothetical protein